MKRLLALPILMLATHAWAADVLPVLRTSNAAGTPLELRDVRIVRVEPDGVRVMHSTGTAKVPYERLPEELQIKYGFDPTKANQHREQTKAQAETAALAQASVSAPSGVVPATVSQGTVGNLVTKEHVKNAWLAECASCFICPSDPQAVAKRKAVAQREAAIRSGAYDGTAEQYAQQANARAAAKN